ncbi:pentatricopeptide repeat-containing At5g50390, chloroplastic [Olea europaea subsp. europaea]|uniref:Pentatricopeptide repeat-containing At5g50390, chloroplastic n=1 Tax=Olea europaea subsp. europaea TaxID=158383 RepID=A0A8S0SBA1_OLEEU|nr:pentatricopeptide repeat-containing At5g50390, chloroplastic [Olea europaea subsp. europaea]
MHYACMIELLGREGLLDEAFALIRDAPFRSTINMWATLLTTCRIHKNFVLGKFAAEKLYGMGVEKLSNYVVLLTIYTNVGKLEETAEADFWISPSCMPPIGANLNTLMIILWTLALRSGSGPIFDAQLMSKIAEKKIKEADRMVSHTT